jgi:hypothetical protein
MSDEVLQELVSTSNAPVLDLVINVEMLRNRIHRQAVLFVLDNYKNPTEANFNIIESAMNLGALVAMGIEVPDNVMQM